MQIRVSTRDCRAAVGKAIVGIREKLEADKATVSKSSYDNLLTGAVANGLHVDANREREMREMVERDVEHMMKQHPGNELLQVLNNYVDMLAYHRGSDIDIDDQDFNLLKAHLPTAQAEAA